MTGRVLVAYGSKFGSTVEIAQAIGTTLRVAVSDDARGLLRESMAKNPPRFRDRRSRSAIEAWAQKIADSLHNRPASPGF